jgi:hypothetical protein
MRLAEVALAGGTTGAKAVDIRRIEIEDDASGEKPASSAHDLSVFTTRRSDRRTPHSKGVHP